MLLRRRPTVLLAPSRLPFILCSSTVQNSFSILVDPSLSDRLTVQAVGDDLRQSIAKATGKRGSGTSTREKEIKGKGFDSILRWCALYQDPVAPSSKEQVPYWNSNSDALRSSMSRGVNDAGLEWIRKNMTSFSCGQSLVLLTLLCEILYRTLYHRQLRHTDTTSDEGEAVSSRTAALLEHLDPVYLDDFVARLHSTSGQLLQHMEKQGNKLEVQSLPILASGLYALFRVRDTLQKGGQPGAQEVRNMLAESAEYFSLLQRVFTQQLRLSSSSSPTVSSTLEAMMSGNPSLGIKVLLTFFLCIDTPTRRALLPTQENGFIRLLSQILLRAIQPFLQLRETSWVDSKSSASRSSAPAPEDCKAEEETEDEVAVLSSPSKSPPEILHSHNFFEECMHIFQNTSTCRPLLRLGLLEYLLVRLYPLESLSPADAHVLPLLLYRIRDLHSQHRQNVVKAIIETSSLWSRHPISTLIRMLPFLYYSKEFLQRSGLASRPMKDQMQSVACISDVESAEILQSAAATLPAPVMVQLQWNVCCAYVDSPTLSEVRHDNLSATHAVVPLVTPLVQILHFYFVRSGKGRGGRRSTPSFSSSGPSSIDSDTVSEEGSALCIQEEKLALTYARLLPLLDWERGLVEKNVLATAPGGPSGDTPYLGDMVAIQMALEVYLVLRENSSDATEHIPVVSDKALLYHYLQPLLLPSNEGVPYSRSVEKLKLVVRANAFLSDDPHRARLMERAIRYNFSSSSKSFQAVLRFLDVLEPSATALSVISTVALTSILDASIVTLNPLRALPRSSFGSGKANLRASGRCYTNIVLSASRYLLMVIANEQGKIPAPAKDIMGKQLTLWLEDYFNTIFRIEYRLAEADAEAPAENNEEVVEEEKIPSDTGASVAYRGDNEGRHTEEGHEEEDSQVQDAPVEEDTAVSREENDEGKSEEEENEEESAAEAAQETDPIGHGENALLSRQEAEVILTTAARLGAHLSSRVYHRMIQQPVDEYCDAIRAAEDGDESSLFSTGVELDRLPLPAHFVYYIRSGKKCPFPLQLDYLSLLLTSCDIRIFHLTFSAYIIGTSAQQQQQQYSISTQRRKGAGVRTPDPVAMEQLESKSKRALWDIIPCAISHLITRLHATPSTVLSPLARSAVVMHVFRVLLHQMDRVTPLTSKTTVPSGAADTYTSGVSIRSMASSAGVSEDGGEVEVCSEEAVRRDVLDSPTAQELLSLEKSLITCCDYIIGKEHIRKICLTYLDKLYQYFPVVAAQLFDKFTSSESNLSHCGLSSKELLLLASSYPPAASLVCETLQSQDVKAAFDFGEYLHLAKNIPMSVAELIIKAHLPALSFGWCSRLLSSLSPRQADIPLPLLSDVLTRVESLVPSATDSDRNLLLMVLQGYLRTPPSVPLIAVAAEDSEEGAVKATDIPVDPRRLERVYSCYDVVVKVERVTDVVTLREFLRVTPPSLHSHVMPALLERVEHILPPLFATRSTAGEAAAQFKEVLLFTRLLHQEKMLVAAVRKTIFHAVFGAQLPHFFRAEEASAVQPLSSSLETTGEKKSDGTLPTDASTRFSLAEGHPLQEEVLPSLVELALLLGRDAGRRSSSSSSVSLPPDSATAGGSEPTPLKSARAQESESSDLTWDAATALEQLRQCFSNASHRLLLLTTLIDLTHPAGSHVAGHPGGSTSPSTSGKGAPIRSAAQHSPSYVAPSTALDRLTLDLMSQCADLSATQLVKLIQLVSKIKRWHLVSMDKSESVPDSPSPHSFHKVFPQLFNNADAHTRCVLMRAISNDPRLLHYYEAFMVQPLVDSIAVLSYEDLELLLTTILQMQSSSLIEILLDAVGTRVMVMLDQCKPSTFVRLLQCHATLGIRDEDLFARALSEMEQQCVFREVRLSTLQIIHFLQSIVSLDLQAPERLLLACFYRVEKVVETLPRHHAVQLARLAVELEMGYNSSIHYLVSSLMDSRTDYRTSTEEREAIELLCDVYDVEAPFHWRHVKLRDRRKKFRQMEAKFYLEQAKGRTAVGMAD